MTRGLFERLLPAGVVAVEAFGDTPGEAMFPGEEEFAGRAGPGRRAEFVTTRRCAREALAERGFPAVAIPRGKRGEPLWPAGVAGSMTHCAGYRAAASALSAARRSRSASPPSRTRSSRRTSATC